MRLPKTALALVALATAIVVSGCGGGAAGTPTPPPISDPNEVITKAITAAPDVKSLHIKLEVAGKISLSALSGASGGSALSGSIDLTGTTMEGDVDVANQAADLKLTLTGMLAMPALGLPSEIIVKDGSTYMKSSSTGKFSKTALGSLTSGLPVSIPSQDAAPSALTDQVATIRKQLTDAGLTVTMMPDDTVGGQAAYHVSMTYPIDKLNSLIASQAGSMASGLTFDKLAIDVWAYKDSQLPAKFEVAVGAGALGNLDITVTITAYNTPVTITAPAAGDIAP
jgi:hypothetical protein